MKINKIALGAGIMTVAILSAACARTGGTMTATDTGRYDSGISTSGEGSVKAVPDMAEISFSVYSEGQDPKTVKNENTESNNRVIEFLKSEGLSEESISTSNMGMTPVYDYSSGTEIIKGYEMQTEIRVTDIAIEDLGGLIDSAVDKGINSIRSVNYFVSDYDERYSEALKLAVKDASNKAETLAEAGGVSLGKVTVISEYGADTSAKYVNGLTNYAARTSSAKSEAAALDSAMIMPGQIEIKANVSMSFEVK